jgi:protein-disulfide isomerase
MSNQNKLLASMAVIAMIVIGWYAIRVLPSSLPQKQSAPTETQNVVRVDPTDPVRGLANASHTIIEFGDMECPTCGSLDPQIADLVKQNPDVRLVWKDCPSSSHLNAETAAEAALCAGDQGKYWEYHDLLIQNQDQLGADLYPALAATLQMNAATFASCLANGAKRAQVQASIEECAVAGVTDLPGFFVNGKAFSGANADVVHEISIELSRN